jgi:hypothetical protein
MTVRRRGLLLAVLPLILLAGCLRAAGQQAGQLPEPPDPRPVGGLASFSPTETAALHTSEEAAVRGCMSSRGFRYLPVPGRSVRSAAASPYALLFARAEGDGYGMTMAAIEARNTAGDPNDKALAGTSPSFRDRWRAALVGTDRHVTRIRTPDGFDLRFSTDGCVYAARERVYGTGWDQRYYLVQGLSNLVLTAVQRAPAYSAAVRAWSECMRGAGYSYPNLQAPRKAVQDRLTAVSGPTVEVGKFELSVARQDYSCQRHARLHETIQSVQRELEGGILRGHQADIEQLTRQRKDALTRVSASHS